MKWPNAASIQTQFPTAVEAFKVIKLQQLKRTFLTKKDTWNSNSCFFLPWGVVRHNQPSLRVFFHNYHPFHRLAISGGPSIFCQPNHPGQRPETAKSVRLEVEILRDRSDEVIPDSESKLFDLSHLQDLQISKTLLFHTYSNTLVIQKSS